MVENEMVKGFPKLFKGVGLKKSEPYEIELKDGAKPHAVHAWVPINLLGKVKDELENLESNRITRKVKKATGCKYCGCS